MYLNIARMVEVPDTCGGQFEERLRNLLLLSELALENFRFVADHPSWFCPVIYAQISAKDPMEYGPAKLMANRCVDIAIKELGEASVVATAATEPPECHCCGKGTANTVPMCLACVS